MEMGKLLCSPKVWGNQIKASLFGFFYWLFCYLACNVCSGFATDVQLHISIAFNMRLNEEHRINLIPCARLRNCY